MANNNELQSLKEHQTTIFHIISYRYSTLKYLFDEYNKDNKGTYSKFIIDTMHVYKQCIVTDLCKLFTKSKFTSQECSFLKNIEKYKDYLSTEAFSEISLLLENCIDDIKKLTEERNWEFAHKDVVKRPKHRLHLGNMENIDKLVNHAQKILDILWNSSYHFEEQTNLSVSKVIELIRKDTQDREDELINNLKNKK